MKVDEYIQSTAGSEFTRQDLIKNTTLKYKDAYYTLQKYTAFGYLTARQIGSKIYYTFVTFDPIEAAESKQTTEEFLSSISGEFTAQDFREHTGHLCAFACLSKLYEQGILNMRKEGKYCWFSLAAEGGDVKPNTQLTGAKRAAKTSERAAKINTFLLEINGPFTSRQFSDATGIAHTGSTAYLKSLVDKKVLKQFKIGTKSFYRKLGPENEDPAV